MAGYLAITHLLALQAGDREEYLLSAEIYGKLAASKIEEAYAYVMAPTWSCSRRSSRRRSVKRRYIDRKRRTASTVRRFRLRGGAGPYHRSR